jgi:type II secretory pathway pseudopilin PulG
VRRHAQSGITLLETVVAAGMLAVAIAGVLFALTGFSKFAAQQGGVARMAALTVAQQTLRVAQDAWKYGSPGAAPSGSQTILLPLSMSTTAPATLTATVSANGSSAQVTVTVQYTPEPNRTGDTGIVSVSGDLVQKAPLPGSQISRTGLIPMPSGAP